MPTPIFQTVSIFIFQIWSPTDRFELLDTLGRLFLEADYTIPVSHIFLKLVPDIIERSRAFVEKHEKLDYKIHQKFCIALSKVVIFSPAAKRSV